MAREDFAEVPTLSGSLSADERITAFLRGVYGWMGCGLAVTAATAWFIANSPSAVALVATNRVLLWGLLIAQLGIVVVLSARVERMAASTASLLFVAYAAPDGRHVVVRPRRLHRRVGRDDVHRDRGHVRRDGRVRDDHARSLAGWGQFLFMGLIGVVLASIVGMFWRSDAPAVRDLVHRRHRLHRPRRLRRAAAEGTWR